MLFRNVVLGISGGVDSAVAALLLKQKGYKVLAVFMKNWDEYDEKGQCSGEQDLLHAEYACRKLDIELRQLNYVKEYWNYVFTNFLEDYQQGLTPNPDILCNKFIKFDLFYKYAIEQLAYDAIATGHYASSNFGNYLSSYKPDAAARLLLPKDKFKDQTFFLAGIQAQALRRSMFPLGNYLKSQVKELARLHGLAKLAQKKESTGICFVGNRNFKQFIKQYIVAKPGKFVDIDTDRIVGEHAGLHQWTVGQRCRLPSCLQPYYVAEKCIDSNVIYVAAGHNNAALFHDLVHANNINWLCPDPLLDGTPLHCYFRFQHTKPLVACQVLRTQDNLLVQLEQPLRAITPGQYAVFYSENECLGSARIVAASKSSIFLQSKAQEN